MIIAVTLPDYSVLPRTQMGTRIPASPAHSIENLVKDHAPLYKDHGTSLADIGRTYAHLSVRESEQFMPYQIQGR